MVQTAYINGPLEGPQRRRSVGPQALASTTIRTASTPDIGLLGQTASDNEIHVYEAFVIGR